MKKIINISTILAFLFIFCSCEDWLDMPSEDKADSSSVFQTLGRAERTVLAAYPYLHTQELGYQLLMGTDESSSTESNSKYNVSNYDYTNLTGMLSSTYNTMYKAIEYSNICIKNLLLMTVSSESEQKKINSLLGESYAIRAYAYWNLVRFYGDVPYSDIPTEDLTTFFSSRVSRDSIWDRCIDDLIQATELLPWKSEGIVSTPERFTKNSAYGILARIALYAAGYSLRWDMSSTPYNESTVKIAQRDDVSRIKELYVIAKNACESVITQNENSLLDDYDQIFRDLALKQYNSETMLEYGWFGANAPDVRTGYTNGIPTSGTSKTFGKGGTQMITMPTLYFEFDEGDQRRDVSICNYGILSNDSLQMSTYLGFGIGKYRIDWKKDRGTTDSKRDINFPLLRYSDVLLMYAEVLNELNNGPNSEAANALKEVRMRAFRNDASKVGSIPTSYEDFKNAIILERKLELSNESLRKTDLTRWGILVDHLEVEKDKIYKLARREGEYKNVTVYRAYKKIKGVLENPIVGIPYISMSNQDIASLKLDLKNDSILNTLNDSGKGYLNVTFYEDVSSDKVYFTKETVPNNIQIKEVPYVILNMFGCHSIKQKGGLSVDEVEGLASKNDWIENMFYGMKKNMVEILPFNTANIIDVNPGLIDQQHPCY
ncbi:MAG: RagB/SusD family nutrient uptake outer membrane protein [Bacteroidales bacterium]|nr:RagB/SusD family nutrient uptake outer membrane protein [Bacteroidales bacterium]